MNDSDKQLSNHNYTFSRASALTILPIDVRCVRFIWLNHNAFQIDAVSCEYHRFHLMVSLPPNDARSTLTSIRERFSQIVQSNSEQSSTIISFSINAVSFADANMQMNSLEFVHVNWINALLDVSSIQNVTLRRADRDRRIITQIVHVSMCYLYDYSYSPTLWWLCTCVLFSLSLLSLSSSLAHSAWLSRSHANAKQKQLLSFSNWMITTGFGSSVLWVCADQMQMYNLLLRFRLRTADQRETCLASAFHSYYAMLINIDADRVEASPKKQTNKHVAVANSLFVSLPSLRDVTCRVLWVQHFDRNCWMPPSESANDVNFGNSF